MVRNPFIPLLGISLLSCGSLAQTHATEILEGIRTAYNLPGLAAARIRECSLTQGAVGLRKIDESKNLQDTDSFHLGSNTKAMTATIIGILADEGSLSWDLTLSEALPEYESIMSEGHRKTTIEMLGAHRSGIQNDMAQDLAFIENLYDPSLTPVDGRKLIIDRVLKQEPAGVSGEYFYDNTNYIILGLLIEKFVGDGSSWEEIITEQLFKPLGMTCGFGPPPQSSISSVDNPWGHYVNRLTDPPIPVGGPIIRRDNPPSLGPAGLVHCDIDSYRKFIQLHLDGFNGRPTSLPIKPETFKKLHTPYPSAPGDTVAYTYGGWIYLPDSTSPWSNGPILTHAGSNYYHYVEVMLAPGLGQAGEAFVALMNAGNAMQGGTVPAGNATLDVFVAMLDGSLFPPGPAQN
ncbi:hypothetical protein FQN51_000704 [Onygenales sp. PD_10]|nr:hypothetical protein FQN51_000704 [Onygenales sp. PD_10]